MIDRAILITIVYAAAVAETAMLRPVPHLQVAWLFLAASYAIWRLPASEASAWSAAIGLVSDALSAAPAGLGLIAFGTAGWLCAQCREQWGGSSLAAYGVTTMTGSALCLGMIASGGATLGAEAGIPRDFPLLIAATAIATGVTGMLVVAVWRTIGCALAANGLATHRRSH